MNSVLATTVSSGRPNGTPSTGLTQLTLINTNERNIVCNYEVADRAAALAILREMDGRYDAHIRTPDRDELILFR